MSYSVARTTGWPCPPFNSANGSILLYYWSAITNIASLYTLYKFNTTSTGSKEGFHSIQYHDINVYIVLFKEYVLYIHIKHTALNTAVPFVSLYLLLLLLVVVVLSSRITGA